MKKTLFILGQLSYDDIEWIINYGKKVFLKDGHILIKQGKAIQELYITLKGNFEIFNENSQTVLAKIGDGEILGEMSYVNENPPSATVKALGDCIVYCIAREELNNKINLDTGFGMRFFKALATMLSDRLRQAQQGENIDELDMGVISKLHKAGARFERILKAFNTNQA